MRGNSRSSEPTHGRVRIFGHTDLGRGGMEKLNTLLANILIERGLELGYFTPVSLAPNER